MDFVNNDLGTKIIWWGLGMIIFILIFLIYLIPVNSSNQRRKKESAYNFLQQQFILGKMTETEYNYKKKNLREKYYLL